jgi:hypothetical protein
MKIGKSEVIVLCGGDLDDEVKQAISDRVKSARFITQVDSGSVTGDDGTGYAMHLISSTDTA